MRVTLQDIAKAAGVSPATVDRVLNNRDGVRFRTREMVLDAARRLGYVTDVSDPSAAVMPPARLRFVLPAGPNAFMAELAGQIERQGAARGDTIVTLDQIEGFNPGTLAAFLQEMDDRTDGVGLVALDHPLVRQAIRDLALRGKKVVTLVSDIHNVPRIAYVGIDNRQAGRLAGYVMGRLLGEARQAKVALFAGSLSYRGHQEREMGFRHILHEEFPHLQIVELREMLDDRAKARAEALILLDRHPDLAAIYNIGAGNSGIGQALKEAGRAASVLFVGHDATAGNKSLLLDGTLDAVIDQNPRVEAREALATLAATARGTSHVPVPPRIAVIFRENLPDD
ncbi:MAG: LacI family DNA-binding transcriptional regulator [Rubellimicrobium sp.]|nr:LacI family DNA-binding transcriptional regulator [Rubellimicrobium sp.]